MANSDPLLPFGIAIIIVVGLFMAFPFFRGKSDVLTAWNTLLLGLVIYSGLGAIEVNYVPTLPFVQLDWFQPTAKEVQWFMWVNAAFIATLLAAYYLNSPAKSFAQKRFRKWPEVTVPVTFFILGCCTLVVVLSVFFRPITFIGPLSFNLAQVAAPTASVFSFRLWYRNRLNVGWLLLFVGVFLGAAMYAMVVSGGRRLLLSVFLGPVLYMYWVHGRHWGRAKIIVTLGLAAVFIISVGIIYSKFRYYSAATRERSAGSILVQMHDLRAKGDWFAVFVNGPLEYFAQSNGHFALLTQRYVAQGALDPKPLNTLKFVLTYPIPRNIWPRKPDRVGLTIVRDAAHLPKGNNWGLGIAGHAVYEGGIPAAILYAVILAFCARLMDEPLRLQPDNPFLICMLAAAFPHIIAIPRGDMGTMITSAGQCVLFAFLLGLACRAIFGTQRNPVRTNANSRHEEYGVYRGLPKARVNP